MTGLPAELIRGGVAYGYVHGWLSGASLSQAVIDGAGNWQIWLTLANGDQGLIVWNPNATVQFSIPGSIQVFEVDDIYGGTKPFSGNSIQVGESPVLLVGH